MKRSGLVLFVLLILYFIFLIRQDIIDSLELKSERQSVVKSIEREEALAGELSRRLRALAGSQYIEELARTRLGLIKKGETAYKVIGR